MTKIDLATLRAAKNHARMDYERQVLQDVGGDGNAAGLAGPPTWSREAWESFKAQWGCYPFGMQNGGMVYPPTFEGAPDWVYELMNLRKPPVETKANPMPATPNLAIFRMR